LDNLAAHTLEVMLHTPSVAASPFYESAAAFGWGSQPVRVIFPVHLEALLWWAASTPCSIPMDVGIQCTSGLATRPSGCRFGWCLYCVLCRRTGPFCGWRAAAGLGRATITNQHQLPTICAPYRKY
jgi:hypothetical protein